MTWHSLICFSLLITSLPAATVSGTVELRESRIASVARGKDYSGVVVSLQSVGDPAAAVPEKHAVMLQKNKMFVPHILPVVAGTTIDFPNEDPIYHNAFSSYSGQIFDVGLYPPGTSRSVRFLRRGIVRVFCNIHPSMSAIILVLTTRYFAVTPHDGSFISTFRQGRTISAFSMSAPPNNRSNRFHGAFWSLPMAFGFRPSRFPKLAT